MYLNSLELRNFRKFEELHIGFDRQLTVLVGDNGYGKSAVVDAAAIALGTFFMHILQASQRSIRNTDARVVSRAVGSTIERRSQFPVIVRADGCAYGRSLSWQRELRRDTGRTTWGNAREMVELSERVHECLSSGDIPSDLGECGEGGVLPLPIISYYGTGRLWAQSKNEEPRTSLREAAYASSLSPRADDGSLMRWLRKMTYQQLQKGEPVPELQAVRRATEECLGRIIQADNVHVFFDVQSNDLCVEIYGDTAISLPLHQLSDGYRTTLGMVADIAYRMAQLNPHYGSDAIERTHGVVLIDEVDLHLHPKWQARILGDLTGIFPGVQFIVTTHSPAVIASVKREKLRSFTEGGVVVIPGNQTYGRDVSSIFREVMDAPERPEKVQLLFQEIEEALDNEQFEKAHEQIERLGEQIGQNDPRLTELKTSLYLSEL